MDDPRTTVARTLRQVAGWGSSNLKADGTFDEDEFYDLAGQVERCDAEDASCPMCQHTVCHDDCPLYEYRKSLGVWR